jgi:5,10-methylenetetrahydromethanopterin reductase
MFQPDSADNLARQGLLAEQLGFEAVWVANMLSTRDPYLALSVLARKSQRIRIGPAAISPFEQHPLKIAGSLLALNEFARGRANIAVGGGGGTIIGMGLKPQRTSNHPRMVRGVRECVQFLRQAATGQPFDFQGELFRAHGFAPVWTVAPPPLIYIAANRPQMLRLAGEMADGVMLSDIALPFIEATMTRLGEGLARGTRRRESLRISNVIAWHVKADRDAAYAEARRNLWVRGIWERARIEPYLTAAECELVQKSLPAWQAAYTAGSDVIPGVPQKVVDTLADNLTLTGGPGDVERLTARLRRYRDAGIDEVALRLYDEPEDSLRLIAGQVMPALA